MSEQNNGTDIKLLSVESIKALLYDQIVLLERTNHNIKVLQNELQTRQEKQEV